MKRTLIYIDGKDRTDQVTSCRGIDGRWGIKFKNSDTEYKYGNDKVKVVKTGISKDSAYNIFNYLKEIAKTVGLKTETGINILENRYNKITLIPKNCILANYLNQSIPESDTEHQTTVFPFKFNISQKDAVNNALSNPLSVIEGPPGTGKTQTILNIIANAIMNNQSVAVVSSNNSATKNVFEKLEKHGIGFIAAQLGSSDNKKEFIDNQSAIPDLSSFSLSEEKKQEVQEKINSLFNQLIEYLSKKNELALLKQELSDVESEHRYFADAHDGETIMPVYLNKSSRADKLLDLWLKIEDIASVKDKIGFLRRISFYFKFGIKDKSFYNNELSQIILMCQLQYYLTKISELKQKETQLTKFLDKVSFDKKMNEYASLSMQVLKDKLHKKYSCKKRDIYKVEELCENSAKFVDGYPVIMSTTYSLRSSLSQDIMYDYLIMDEASQVDIATGALALSCAKRAVIVGDLKQLPNVVDSSMRNNTDLIYNDFNLASAYRYSTNSLLSSMIKLFPDVPKTLLKEHYRCNTKIIEFCNKKFYDNQLIIHTNDLGDREPLKVYRTPPGNHARTRTNQRQIDIIQHEIVPKENLNGVDLGIVTPYRDQTNALQKAFKNTTIKADTVDKFQGRENDVIILSTVDNEISEFTDNPNRLNVAVSRAIEQLILVVNGNEDRRDNNINDLIKYIEYNNFAVVESNLNSIFDYLYKGLEEKRAEIIKKSGKVSEFDSENLMYALIKEILTDDNFSKYGVVLHCSLRSLIKDTSILNEQEHKYATNPLTHLDFLIYNKLGKVPVLAIEVDGYEYHKDGTRQAERDKMKDDILLKYNLPLLRFATNGSNEKAILRTKLLEIQNN